jgi:hypothetical protein
LERSLVDELLDEVRLSNYKSDPSRSQLLASPGSEQQCIISLVVQHKWLSRTSRIFQKRLDQSVLTGVRIRKPVVGVSREPKGI